MSVSKAKRTSADLTDEQLSALRHILPEAFAEDKIDWDKLRKLLGDNVDAGVERFGLTWPGKTSAIRSVLTPSTLTLRPEKDESVQFDTTENLFIEGDNLEVLKLLQKTYHSAVKMIYIDPPYNTGGDFVYHDDFTAPLDNYLKQTGQKDGSGNGFHTNRETGGRYHSDWLSMIYPRLKLAWNLLRDDGVIFVSIDDNEVHHLRDVLDEIFGEENFLATFLWKKKGTSTNVEGASVSSLTEYIVAYERAESSLNLRVTSKEDRAYPFEDDEGKYRKAVIEKKNTGSYERATMQFEIIGHTPRPGKRWQIGEATAKELERKNRFVYEDGIVRLKIYEAEDKDSHSANPNLFFEHGSSESATKSLSALFEGGSLFDTPKPVELLQKLIQLSTSKDGNNLVLDFFSGSGTTAHAVMMQNAEDGGNRKWVCVQLPEPTPAESEAHKAGYKIIADIAKERIRRAAKKIAAEDGKKQKLDYGFKAFELGRSNYVENNFEYDPDKSEAENARAFSDYLARVKQQGLFGKVQDIDVVYENIVKEGLSLNAAVTEEKLADNKAYRVRDGESELLICLDASIKPETIKTLTSPPYKGKTFICLDLALDDSKKANLGLNLELKTI